MSSATCVVPSGILASAQRGMSVTLSIVRSPRSLWLTPRTLLKFRRNQLPLRLWPLFQQSLLLRLHMFHLRQRSLLLLPLVFMQVPLRLRGPKLRLCSRINLCRASPLCSILMPIKHNTTTIGLVLATTVTTRTTRRIMCIHPRATIVARVQDTRCAFCEEEDRWINICSGCNVRMSWYCTKHGPP
jgi:hypothetical protein